MIHYNKGMNSKSYSDIALFHWEQINPKTKAGNYRKRESLVGRVEILRDKYRNVNHRKFQVYEALLADDNFGLDLLVTSEPHEFAFLNRVMKRILKKRNLLNKEFFEELSEKVFQYENWRSNGKFEQIVELMDIKICPYCNHQDVFKDEERDVMIISCDHYLDKARYPWFSLSFYNLIPVCKICNETYKGQKSFRISTHIHPYIDNYNALGKFNHDFVHGSLTHNINLESTDQRLKNSSKAFGILQRYGQQSVKAVSKQMYYHAIDYTLSKKEELVVTWGLMDLDEVEKKICYRYDIPSHEMEIRQFSLGKLKRDLALKYKLIAP